MSIQEYKRVYTCVHKYHEYTSYTSAHIHEYERVYMSTHMYTRLYTGLLEYTQVWMSVHEYTWCNGDEFTNVIHSST